MQTKLIDFFILQKQFIISQKVKGNQDKLVTSKIVNNQSIDGKAIVFFIYFFIEKIAKKEKNTSVESINLFTKVIFQRSLYYFQTLFLIRQSKLDFFIVFFGIQVIFNSV